MSALLFLDTETTGLSLSDDIWEIAAVRREENGSESELHLFLEHDEAKCSRLPEAFRDDHRKRFPSSCSGDITPRDRAARLFDNFLDGKPHIVGAVPNFDTERIERLFEVAGGPLWRRWHHHLIDVETLAFGYLAGIRSFDGHECRDGMKAFSVETAFDSAPALPWDSNALSLAIGVDPAEFPRHTAMGDVRWCMAIYDQIMSGPREESS